MANIETLMNDFREMAGRLKHLKAQLEWVNPENCNAMYTYKYNPELGVFNVYTHERSDWRGHLTKAEIWKFDVLIEIEEAFFVSTYKSIEEFGRCLGGSAQEIQMEAEEVAEWVKQHPDVDWMKDEEEEGENNERD